MPISLLSRIVRGRKYCQWYESYMNVGKNERSSQGLVNYINFFRQLANNKYFSTFYSQYYLNYYILFFLYIFWNSGTRIQILQNITAIILNSLGVQNQKIKKVFNIGVGSSNKKISIQLSLLVSLIIMYDLYDTYKNLTSSQWFQHYSYY